MSEIKDLIVLIVITILAYQSFMLFIFLLFKQDAEKSFLITVGLPFWSTHFFFGFLRILLHPIFHKISCNICNKCIFNPSPERWSKQCNRGLYTSKDSYNPRAALYPIKKPCFKNREL